MRICEKAAAQFFKIAYGCIHSSHVLIHEGAHLDLAGDLVGDEIFAEGWQCFQKLALAPKETHVGRKYLIAGTDQVIAVPTLYVDDTVRSVVNRIQKDFDSRRVRNTPDFFHISH